LFGTLSNNGIFERDFSTYPEIKASAEDSREYVGMGKVDVSQEMVNFVEYVQSSIWIDS
jgi:hypothetical protein